MLNDSIRSKENISKYFEYAQSHEVSRSQYYNLCAVYSLKGDTKKAIEQMKLFSTQKNIAYFRIRNLKDDPVFDNIRELPEFHTILSEIETRFWENHKRIKTSLEKKGLL